MFTKNLVAASLVVAVLSAVGCGVDKEAAAPRTGPFLSDMFPSDSGAAPCTYAGWTAGPFSVSPELAPSFWSGADKTHDEMSGLSGGHMHNVVFDCDWQGTDVARCTWSLTMSDDGVAFCTSLTRAIVYPAKAK